MGRPEAESLLINMQPSGSIPLDQSASMDHIQAYRIPRIDQIRKVVLAIKNNPNSDNYDRWVRNQLDEERGQHFAAVAHHFAPGGLATLQATITMHSTEEIHPASRNTILTRMGVANISMPPTAIDLKDMRLPGIVTDSTQAFGLLQKWELTTKEDTDKAFLERTVFELRAIKDALFRGINFDGSPLNPEDRNKLEQLELSLIQQRFFPFYEKESDNPEVFVDSKYRQTPEGEFIHYYVNENANTWVYKTNTPTSGTNDEAIGEFWDTAQRGGYLPRNLAPDRFFG